MLDGWRGFGVARRGWSALARGVDTHDIIPTPPFRILLLTSSEKASLFQSPAAILGRKSPSAALSKLGYPAQVGSPTICGVFCIKVDNKLRNKSVLVLEPVESQGGRMVARKRGTSTCRLIRSLKDYVLCRHSFRAPAENGQLPVASSASRLFSRPEFSPDCRGAGQAHCSHNYLHAPTTSSR